MWTVAVVAMGAAAARAVVAGLVRAGRSVGGRVRSDRGAASVWVLAVGVVLVVVAATLAMVGSVRTARHEARAAADFGALAGAARAVEGEAPACARAAQLVAANGARMAGCRLDGFDVIVSAEVPVTPLPGVSRIAAATSRAGPVRATD